MSDEADEVMNRIKSLRNEWETKMSDKKSWQERRDELTEQTVNKLGLMTDRDFYRNLLAMGYNSGFAAGRADALESAEGLVLALERIEQWTITDPAEGPELRARAACVYAETKRVLAQWKSESSE